MTFIYKDEISNYERQDFIEIIKKNFYKLDENLINEANEVRILNYGKKVYLRGLIETSNYCKKNCYYCGIQSSNNKVIRYRLTESEILESARLGYEIGLRTFVMQSGEDNYFTDDKLVSIISKIKYAYNDCAITLSLGERTYESYKKLFDSGADRYLLRHETATKSHYETLHPKELTLENRMNCLKNLKEIGFQTGAGFMVDSPNQTIENLADELIFLREFQPHMVGIGPFLPSKYTKFENSPKGILNHTIVMLALTRLLLPTVLLPSTTALGSLSENGREQGLKAGCNVIMPNISPTENRKNYSLYDNKISKGSEVLEGIQILCEDINKAGYEADFSIGNHKNI